MAILPSDQPGRNAGAAPGPRRSKRKSPTQPRAVAPTLDMTPAEAKALAQLYARRDAFAESDEARMIRGTIDTARLLLVRLTTALEAVGNAAEAEKKILSRHGLKAPDNVMQFGTDTFAHFREEAGVLVEMIEGFLGILVGELPPCGRAAA